MDSILFDNKYSCGRKRESARDSLISLAEFTIMHVGVHRPQS